MWAVMSYVQWMSYRGRSSYVGCYVLRSMDALGWTDYICRGERIKFDRFVDPNVRGAKRRIYSDLRIYCN